MRILKERCVAEALRARIRQPFDLSYAGRCHPSALGQVQGVKLGLHLSVSIDLIRCTLRRAFPRVGRDAEAHKGAKSVRLGQYDLCNLECCATLLASRWPAAQNEPMSRRYQFRLRAWLVVTLAGACFVGELACYWRPDKSYMNTSAGLYEAIEDADAAKVRRILMDHPERLDVLDDGGFTPLMHAVSCVRRSVPVIRAILEAGANVNRQTDEGYTALHCAIYVNGEANLNAGEVIGLLVSAGADLKSRQHYGWTPLLRAVVEGTAAEVKALLAAGADPNETMPFDTLPAFNAGRTTLMAAVTSPEAEVVVHALLRAGADPHRRDANSMNFFEYAEMVQRESGPGEFAEEVQRCADLARQWKRNG